MWSMKSVKVGSVWIEMFPSLLSGKLQLWFLFHCCSCSFTISLNIICHIISPLAQDKLAGVGVGICEDLISLEIVSPDVPDLTLIDLPGIARVAVKGQPENIGDQVCYCSSAYCYIRAGK